MSLLPSDVAARRAQLWEAGFRPIPILNWDAKVPSPGKQPLARDWRQDALKDPPFCLTVPPVAHALNSGILCDGLRAIDLDIDDPALAARCRAIAVDRFGEAPIRMRRNSARCLILYRAASGTPPKIAITGATHSKVAGCKIEVLGAGQQFVAFGRHDSGADLEWFPEAPGEATLLSLPAITEQDVISYLEAVAPLLGAEPPTVKANGHDHQPHSAGDAQAEPLRVAAAVASIPNTGAPDWECWNKIGMAIYAATGGSAIGGELFNEWSKRHPSYDETEAEDRWRHYRRSPPTSIGAGTLFHLAGNAFRQQPEMEEPPDYITDPGQFFSADPDAPTLEELPEPTAAPELTKVFDPWNVLEPVKFPIDIMPQTLRDFARSRAETIGADPCALAWSAISACSSAIHGETRLLMKRHDTWSVPAAIWVALVGAPSTMKTPIIDAAWRPLNRVQNNELRNWQMQLAQWRAMTKKEREKTPEPIPKRRLISHDGTMEKIQDILSLQSRGIGIVRDELSGWIGSMEKYAPGKGGAADRAFWLQSYNGGSHVVDRVMRGTLPIDNLLTTICGGIQPDRLRQFGDLTDDGLWQRFVPIIVAPAALGHDREADRTVELYDALIQRLLDDNQPQTVKLSPNAHQIREEMQSHLHRLELAEVLGTRFTGFVGKMAGLWGRLALVFHMAGGNAGRDVSEQTAEAARKLVLHSVLPNAARVYTAMGGQGGDIEATQSIAGYILTKRLSRIVMSDLTSSVRVCRHRSAEDVRKLLSPLQAGGWLAPEKDYNPTSWLVSDFVHAQFEERARRETERRGMVREIILGAATQRRETPNPDNPDYA